MQVAIANPFRFFGFQKRTSAHQSCELRDYLYWHCGWNRGHSHCCYGHCRQCELCPTLLRQRHSRKFGQPSVAEAKPFCFVELKNVWTKLLFAHWYKKRDNILRKRDKHKHATNKFILQFLFSERQLHIAKAGVFWFFSFRHSTENAK